MRAPVSAITVVVGAICVYAIYGCGIMRLRALGVRASGAPAAAIILPASPAASLVAAKASARPQASRTSAAPRGSVGNKRIALAFDDFPFERGSDQVLDILKREGVPVTFFAIGSKARQLPSLVDRAVSEGHSVQNHTWSHKSLRGLSEGEALLEITRCADAIEAITGERPYLLRAPGGRVNGHSRATALKAQHFLVREAVNTGDYAIASAAALRERVRRRAQAGSILVFHDAVPATTEALGAIIGDLRAAGYTFVTVNEMTRPRPAQWRSAAQAATRADGHGKHAAPKQPGSAVAARADRPRARL